MQGVLACYLLWLGRADCQCSLKMTHFYLVVKVGFHLHRRVQLLVQRLIVLNDLGSLLCHILVGHVEVLVSLLVGCRNTERVDAVVDMRVLAPAQRAVGLHRQNRVAGGKHREEVVEGRGF